MEYSDIIIRFKLKKKKNYYIENFVTFTLFFLLKEFTKIKKQC